MADEQQKAACNVLTGASSNDFNAEFKKVNDPKKADERTSIIPLSANNKQLQSSMIRKETSMPPISPIINGSSGIINFTVIICPTGPISYGHTATVSENDRYQDLLKDIDISNFFSAF